jgi:hypothetical protein
MQIPHDMTTDEEQAVANAIDELVEELSQSGWDDRAGEAAAPPDSALGEKG